MDSRRIYWATFSAYAALALGLIARQNAQRADGAIDEEVGRMLQQEFLDAASDDTKSAM